MPITYDITKDGLYKEGKEVGREEGLREGLKERTNQMIIKALRMGALTIEQIAEMAEVDASYVLHLQKQLGNDE